MKKLTTIFVAMGAAALITLGSCSKKAEQAQDQDSEAVETEAVEASDATKATEASETGLTVYDFSATWCGPCQQFKPVFEAAAQHFKGITFQSVDIDENPTLADKYGVSSIPCVVIIDKQGNIISQTVGAMTAVEFEALINAALQTQSDK